MSLFWFWWTEVTVLCPQANSGLNDPGESRARVCLKGFGADYSWIYSKVIHQDAKTWSRKMQFKHFINNFGQFLSSSLDVAWGKFGLPNNAVFRLLSRACRSGVTPLVPLGMSFDPLVALRSACFDLSSYKGTFPVMFWRPGTPRPWTHTFRQTHAPTHKHTK